MPESWENFQNINIENKFDLELLKKEVGQRFPFYDIRFTPNSIMFFCHIDKESLEEKFDSLRQVLSEKGYIPMLRYERGEQIIYVIKKPKIRKRPIYVNILLLIATIFTTTLAGATLWYNIYIGDWIGLEILEPSYLIDGFIYFSIPLMLILGIHEMGHYYVSKKHNLDTSLPFFIPLPPPFILGTFGAIISTREPIPNRKALLDIGVSGPFCGFLVAIPVSLVGLFFMQQNPIFYAAENTDQVFIVFPLLLQGLSNFFNVASDAAVHPTLFAGWVGFFLTAVNLLPIGQLDGGHVAKALLKDNYKYASYAVIIAILAMGMFYTGWLMFAIIILFLIGTRHQPPLNEYTPLDTRRKIIGVLAFIVFIICFAPIPFISQ